MDYLMYELDAMRAYVTAKAYEKDEYDNRFDYTDEVIVIADMLSVIDTGRKMLNRKVVIDYFILLTEKICLDEELMSLLDSHAKKYLDEAFAVVDSGYSKYEVLVTVFGLWTPLADNTGSRYETPERETWLTVKRRNRGYLIEYDCWNFSNSFDGWIKVLHGTVINLSGAMRGLSNKNVDGFADRAWVRYRDER